MNNELSERLKQARKYLNLSQEFVAKKTGLQRTAITAIELGQRNVSSEELVKFADLYGVSTEELLYGKDQQSNIKAFARMYSELSENDKLEIQNLIQYKLKLRKSSENANNS